MCFYYILQLFIAKDLIRSGSRTLAPIAQAGAVSFDDFTPRSGLKTQRWVLGLIFPHIFQDTSGFAYVS